MTKTIGLKELFDEAARKHPIRARKPHSKKSKKTGFTNVFLVYCSSCRQKFMFQYRYREDGRTKAISSTNLSRLKEKMNKKGFSLTIDDSKLAKETFRKFGGV